MQDFCEQGHPGRPAGQPCHPCEDERLALGAHVGNPRMVLECSHAVDSDCPHYDEDASQAPR